MRSFMFFIWIGLALGVPLGWFAKSLWEKFLLRRDARVKARVAGVALRARVSDVPTETLVDELSTRDDMVRTKETRKR